MAKTQLRLENPVKFKFNEGNRKNVESENAINTGTVEIKKKKAKAQREMLKDGDWGGREKRENNACFGLTPKPKASFTLRDWFTVSPFTCEDRQSHESNLWEKLILVKEKIFHYSYNSSCKAKNGSGFDFRVKKMIMDGSENGVWIGHLELYYYISN